MADVVLCFASAERGEAQGQNHNHHVMIGEQQFNSVVCAGDIEPRTVPLNYRIATSQNRQHA